MPQFGSNYPVIGHIGGDQGDQASLLLSSNDENIEIIIVDNASKSNLPNLKSCVSKSMHGNIYK